MFADSGLVVFFTDPVKKVALGVSDLSKSLEYWSQMLGMTVYEQTDTKAVLGYSENQCSLELIQLDCPVNHATAFGRIAFSCPRAELPTIESKVKAAGHTILTPLVALDTPGKATVEVIILADPVSFFFYFEVTFFKKKYYCNCFSSQPNLINCFCSNHSRIKY